MRVGFLVLFTQLGSREHHRPVGVRWVQTENGIGFLGPLGSEVDCERITQGLAGLKAQTQRRTGRQQIDTVAGRSAGAFGALRLGGVGATGSCQIARWPGATAPL